jgi:hypothetical protein
MREIEVTATFDVPRVEVERRLSPESIIEYAGTYEVESIEHSGERTVLTATGNDIGTIIEFTEREDGYRYTQVGDDGPFEEMRTQIRINGNDETRVSVRSAFTFGGWLSVLTDWLGTDIRRDELERLLVNLADDLADDSDKP